MTGSRERGTKHDNDDSDDGGDVTNGHRPQTGSSPLYALSCLILTTLKDGSDYYPHFTVWETEEQRDDVICTGNLN